MTTELIGTGAALHLGGQVLGEQAVRERVDATVATLPEGGPIIVAADTDPVTALVLILAGGQSGQPVIVASPAVSSASPAILSATSSSGAALALPDLPPGVDLVLLTSGSSGTPRCVARTWRSWTLSFPALSTVLGMAPAPGCDEASLFLDTVGQGMAPAPGCDTVVGLTGPLHVSMHLFAALHGLWLGATVTDAVEGASLVHATPTTIARLLAHGHRPQHVVVAGASMPGAVLDRARAAGITVTEYYGAAELSFVAARTHRAGQAGKHRATEESSEFTAPPPPRTPALDPFPGVTIEVRNGELWAASPYLSLGYLVPDHEGSPSPQAAARFIRGADSGATSTTGPFRCDDSGFATVGDRAEITPDGRYRILGRGDASITVSGTTVIAEDVERVIAEFPGVYAAAVVAVADPVHGDVPVAVVECVHRPDPGHTATLATAWVEQAHARLGAPARPRAWYLIEKLPRTASGKIARGQVIDALHGSGSTNLPAAKTRIETVNTEDPAPKGQPTTTPPGLIPLCEAPGEDPALVPRTQMLIPICEAPRLNGHPLTLERIDRP